MIIRAHGYNRTEPYTTIYKHSHSTAATILTSLPFSVLRVSAGQPIPPRTKIRLLRGGFRVMAVVSLFNRGIHAVSS